MLLLIGCAFLLVGAAGAFAADYVGHDACKTCHGPIYDNYIQTGHPFKLNKVEGGQAPIYPFSEVPNPPEGYTWDDVTYVIGGYGWKARFIDSNGYIITGDAVQYNLATQGWVGYHADEDPGTKPYTCGACHTTGWQTTDENGGVKQDGLEGMAGTFAAPGITCEQCHGPGSDHVGGPSEDNIVKDNSKELCGTCHFRDAEHRIAASGGLIRHHEQYDELVNSPHRFMDCITCHDPHKGVVYDLGGTKDQPTCTTCHGDVTVKVEAMAAHSCESCHMPKASKSAVKTGEFEREDDTGFLGDINSHTFRLNVDPNAKMFSDDGKFVNLDADGNAVVKVEYACAGCHNGVEASARSVDWMYANAEIVHTGGPTAVEEIASPVLPVSAELHQNYPNPFNPATYIRFDLPEAGWVELSVYDVRGALVQSLVDEYHQAGRYLTTWNGLTEDGEEVASGVYFYRLQVGDLSLSRPMTLVR